MVKYAKWLIVFSLWVYILLRAVYVPITHDEAYSYLLIKSNYISAMAGTANTHWLNSLGMKIGSLLLGDQPWQLRIFSMLAWFLFGFSAINISEQIKNKFAGTGLFIVLVANPFLLDFFSLARGYGLACAFILAAIWKSFEALDKNTWQWKQWIPAVLFTSLAVLSNYTSFYFFISFIGAYIFFIVAKKQWKIIWPPKFNWWWLLVIGTGLIAVSNLLFIKFYTGDLDYGSDSGFVSSLFGSLIRGSLYFHGERYSSAISYSVVALLFISIAYAFYLYKNYKEVSSFIFFSLVGFLMFLFIIAFHLFFKIPFLFSRTTLLFYPVIAIVIFYFFDELKLRSSVKNFIVASFSLAVVAIFIFHFFSVFNFSYCYEWRDQAETKKCLDAVVQDKGRNVLINKWHYGVFKNYYSLVNKGKYNFNATQFGDDELSNISDAFADTMRHYDHAILLPPFDLQKMRDKGLHFTVLKQFPITGAAVLRMEPK